MLGSEILDLNGCEVAPSNQAAGAIGYNVALVTPTRHLWVRPGILLLAWPLFALQPSRAAVPVLPGIAGSAQTREAATDGDLPKILQRRVPLRDGIGRAHESVTTSS